MAEQRLIDSNADVYPYVETWTCNCSEYGVQKVMAVDDISTLPEIDPENITVVRQLREENERLRKEVMQIRRSENPIMRTVTFDVKYADFMDAGRVEEIATEVFAGLVAKVADSEWQQKEE